MFSALTLALAAVGVVSAAPSTLVTDRADILAPYESYRTQCISDIKIVACQHYNCTVDGYHKIAQSLSQTNSSTQWNYVFYSSSPSASSCITDLKVKVFAAGASTNGWSIATGSAHAGIAADGGPIIGYKKDSTAQTAGSVVDAVVLKAGITANRTLGYFLDYTNLGLGGNVSDPLTHADWQIYTTRESSFMYLSWAKAGPISPITNVTAVSCAADSAAWACGADLISAGWERIDIDVNGETTGSQLTRTTNRIYLFTKSAATPSLCLTGMSITQDISKASVKVNLNDGTTGTAIYLQTTYESAANSTCVTRLAPADEAVFWEEYQYNVVSDANGPSNLNLGILGDATQTTYQQIDPVYLFYTTIKKEIQPDPNGSLYNLAFNDSGDFVIAHISDLHMSHHIAGCRDQPSNFTTCTDRNSTYWINRALDLIKPDLIVINGDLMSQNQFFNKTIPFRALQTRASLIRIARIAFNRGIPWAVTFGNHDDEGDATREEIMRLVQQLPYSVSFRGVPSLPGIGNYHLDIRKSVSSVAVGHRLWFMDSGAYSSFPVNGSVYGYGKVEEQTVSWFTSTSASLGSANAVNATAFFHIPLAEISDSILNTTTKLPSIIGVHREPVCSQGNTCDDLNLPKNTLFNALVNSKSVKSAWSGHDHSNDYILTRNGISLGYDGSAGYGAYSTGDPNYNREMRVIAIHNYGQSSTTYKVIDDIFAGTIHRNTSEPVVTLF